MTRNPQMAPDWGLLFDDLLGAGLNQEAIGAAMGVDLTDRMLRHYRAGVQPAFHRGDAVVELWCKRCKKKRGDLPMLPVVRGHRVPTNREVSQAPRLAGNLPSFPPIQAAAAKVAAAVKRATPRRKKEQPA